MTDPRTKFKTTRKELGEALIEREAEIDLALVGLLAGEHVLLVGPPGCAKSMLLDALLSWMGGRKFTALLNKFSTPEEVFGPVSLAGLKADVYRRVTTGKLPEADVAFLDECFKASTAILNTLLKVLNERKYEVGDGTVLDCPLKLCVAASNEWPSPEGGKELAALFDRFLLRKSVQPVRSKTGRKKLLWGRDHKPKLSTSLGTAELEAARQEANSLDFSAEAQGALEEILDRLGREGVQPGDRRQFKAVGVARAYAWLEGATEVTPDHLEVLQYVLWDEPVEQPRKAAQVILEVANPAGMRVASLLAEAEQILDGVAVKDVAGLATAAAKLKDIHEKIPAGHPKGAAARAYVKERVQNLKKAAMASI